jgi:hypothetical protein
MALTNSSDGGDSRTMAWRGDRTGVREQEFILLSFYGIRYPQPVKENLQCKSSSLDLCSLRYA